MPSTLLPRPSCCLLLVLSLRAVLTHRTLLPLGLPFLVRSCLTATTLFEPNTATLVDDLYADDPNIPLALTGEVDVVVSGGGNFGEVGGAAAGMAGY